MIFQTASNVSAASGRGSLAAVSVFAEAVFGAADVAQPHAKEKKMTVAAVKTDRNVVLHLLMLNRL